LKEYPEGNQAGFAHMRIAELEEEATWKLAGTQRTLEAYTVYLNTYENGKYAIEARRRIEELTKGEVPSAVANIARNMIRVSGGIFTMGCTSEQDNDCFEDETPVHLVTLSDYFIGRYEVTQSEWLGVMGVNPSYFPGCDACPVEQVSWDDVQDFLRRLNRMTRGGYRLPTEAEWEYAARGGSSSRGYKIAGSNGTERVSWYEDNSGIRTHPVGQKQSNELGLHDMSGNVWEWCYDWIGSYGFGSEKNP